MIVEKNQIIAISYGEYSDYEINGLVRVVSRFDLDAETKKWVQGNTKERSRLSDKEKEVVLTGTNFLPWLVASGLVELVNYVEVHTGAYGVVDVNVH